MPAPEWASKVLETMRWNHRPRSRISGEMAIGWDRSQDAQHMLRMEAVFNDPNTLVVVVEEIVRQSAIFPEHLPLYH